MMYISSKILLIIFGVGLGLLTLLGLGHFFHALRFTRVRPIVGVSSLMFLFGMIVILMMTALWLRPVDWNSGFGFELPSAQFIAP